MQPNPFSGLIKSRKFWLAVLDAFIGSMSLALTWFLAPEKVMQVMTLFGLWQPVLVTVILSIAAEDVANAKAGAELYKADKSLLEAKIYQDMPVTAVPYTGEPKG